MPGPDSKRLGFTARQPRPNGDLSQGSDTIQVAGPVNLNTDATFEAWINLSSLSESGNVWNEVEGNFSDKWLGVAPGNVEAYVWPTSPTVPWDGPAALTLGQWHHIAYTKQGTTERLYYDGNLINQRACGLNIGNGPDSFQAVGGIFRDPLLHASFLGDIDSLRLSSIARYTGATYQEPVRDMPTDSNTVLLYLFDEVAGSTTETDSSGNGHTGTLGAGFVGATSPRFNTVPEPGSLAAIGFGVLVMVRRRRVART